MKHYHINYRCIITIVIVFTTGLLKAQTNQSPTVPSDTVTQKVAKRLVVSKEKAKQIQDAYSYRHKEIEKLMQDSTRKSKDKHRELARLMKERKLKIDSTLTPAQKQTLAQGQAGLQKAEIDRRNQLIRRHEIEMNNVPHKRVIKAATDTTKKNINSKKN